MKLHQEHIFPLTAVVLVFASIGCTIASRHWHSPVLGVISTWLFVGGVLIAFLPLIFLLGMLGWERLTKRRGGR
jgi:hypothetical protein